MGIDSENTKEIILEGMILDRNSPSYDKYLKQVFKLRYEEMIYEYDDTKDAFGSDFDEYDKYCDHAVVIDKKRDEVIGTYRFIMKSQIKALNEKFLLENEFNIDTLKDVKLLEVGRACVKKEYRDGSAIMLLWKEAINYAIKNNVDIMLGTASFHGTCVNKYIDEISFILNKYPYEKLCYAINNVYEIYEKTIENEKEIFRKLPSLIKGYMRLGSKFGKNVYIDKEFNSCDVLVITPIKEMNEKYLNRFVNK